MIVLRAKQVEFDVTYINLREKPDWFLEISPHGKVPVLAVNDENLFESNAIAEFLEEQEEPALHPGDAIKRARNRAWTDFVPAFAGVISSIYYSESKKELDASIAAAPDVIRKLETALQTERGDDGPFFNGSEMCLVDAAYAPFFQRFALVEEKLKTGLLDAFPNVKRWSEKLMASDIVTGAVAENFETEFVRNLQRRNCHAGSLFPTA